MCDPIVDDLYNFNQKIHGRLYSVMDKGLVCMQKSGKSTYLNLPKDTAAQQKFIAERISEELARIQDDGLLDVSDLIPVFAHVLARLSTPPDETEIKSFMDKWTS